ncbi:MAG: MerR family transcriptional regulator [Oscillospiraceae bacterium]|nr:MerR family transcriptional regulator [Oscillospiraceae bacterium]
MRGKIYTTGEFAKLCKTTKATLMLYDKYGILKPDYIGENGYRYYSENQYPFFGFINIFKKTGASLGEIKEIFSSHDSAKLIKILEEKRAELALRQVELLDMQKEVDYLLSSAENIHYGNGDVYLKYFPEEYFISYPSGYTTPPEKGHYFSWESFGKLKQYISLKNYVTAKGTYPEMVNAEDFSKGLIYPSHYIAKIPFKADDPNLFIKPSGIYAVANYFDEWDSIPENGKIFKKELERRGYRWSGNLFTNDIAFTLLLNDKKAFGYTFSIKTEP